MTPFCYPAYFSCYQKSRGYAKYSHLDYIFASSQLFEGRYNHILALVLRKLQLLQGCDTSIQLGCGSVAFSVNNVTHNASSGTQGKNSRQKCCITQVKRTIGCQLKVCSEKNSLRSLSLTYGFVLLSQRLNYFGQSIGAILMTRSVQILENK